MQQKIENIVMIMSKHLQINKILVLNNPKEVGVVLKK